MYDFIKEWTKEVMFGIGWILLSWTVGIIGVAFIASLIVAFFTGQFPKVF